MHISFLATETHAITVKTYYRCFISWALVIPLTLFVSLALLIPLALGIYPVGVSILYDPWTRLISVTYNKPDMIH